jgi:hypothetical protein
MAKPAKKRVSDTPDPSVPKRPRQSTSTPTAKATGKPPTTPKKDLVWVRDPVDSQYNPAESPYIHKKALALFKDLEVHSGVILF